MSIIPILAPEETMTTILELGKEEVILDKVFGPGIFASLKIIPDLKTNSWISNRTWEENADRVEWERMHGQVDFESIKQNENLRYVS